MVRTEEGDDIVEPLSGLSVLSEPRLVGEPNNREDVSNEFDRLTRFERRL